MTADLGPRLTAKQVAARLWIDEKTVPQYRTPVSGVRGRQVPTVDSPPIDLTGKIEANKGRKGRCGNDETKTPREGAQRTAIIIKIMAIAKENVQKQQLGNGVLGAFRFKVVSSCQ